MEDRNIPSPASSSSTTTTATCHRRRPHMVEDSDAATCTCQSCTAGVIADCVAVCCCPCAVVNILALVFVKLPWAVARRCIIHRRTKNRRRLKENNNKKRKKKCCVGNDDVEKREKVVTSEIVACGEKDLNLTSEDFINSTEFNSKAGDEVWLELHHNVGHLGFGRVSFTETSPCHGKGS